MPLKLIRILLAAGSLLLAIPVIYCSITSPKPKENSLLLLLLIIQGLFVVLSLLLIVAAQKHPILGLGVTLFEAPILLSIRSLSIYDGIFEYFLLLSGLIHFIASLGFVYQLIDKQENAQKSIF